MCMCLFERTKKELKKKKTSNAVKVGGKGDDHSDVPFFFFQFGAKRVQLWEKAERANMKNKKNRWRNVSES